MGRPKTTGKEHVVRHKDGSLWAKGRVIGDSPAGYWEWFRKDGSRLRSGHFDPPGVQSGEWTTYDKRGEIYKVTKIKPKPRPKPAKCG